MWTCSNCGETGSEIHSAEKHLRWHRECSLVKYSVHGSQYALKKRRRNLFVHERGQLTGWRRWLIPPNPVPTA